MDDFISHDAQISMCLWFVSRNNEKGLDMEMEVWNPLVMFGKKETEIMKVEPGSRR